MKKKLISTKMKITMLVLLLLSITFYVSGCIGLVQSGYKLSDYAHELHLNAENFKYNFDFDNFDFDFNTSSISKDYPISDHITEIDFNLNSQDVKVNSYDGDNLSIDIKSHSTISSELPQSELGNKLIFNAKYDTPRNCTITVNVPEKFKDKGIIKIVTSSGNINADNLFINTLNTSSASGHVEASNLNLSYLSLCTSSGHINLDHITASCETKLTSSSGHITGSGSLGSLTSSTSSGHIDLKLINSLSNSSISTHSGSVTLSMPKDLGYKVNFKTASGNLRSSNNQLSYGDESTIIDVNTVSGNLSIE